MNKPALLERFIQWMKNKELVIVSEKDLRPGMVFVPSSRDLIDQYFKDGGE